MNTHVQLNCHLLAMDINGIKDIKILTLQSKLHSGSKPSLPNTIYRQWNWTEKMVEWTEAAAQFYYRNEMTTILCQEIKNYRLSEEWITDKQILIMRIANQFFTTIKIIKTSLSKTYPKIWVLPIWSGKIPILATRLTIIHSFPPFNIQHQL